VRGDRYDADDIVPNLHPGRRGRSRGDTDTQVPPGTVVPGSGTNAAAGTTGSTSSTTGAAPATNAAPAPGATPALNPSAFAPGGPFMRST
jgi:hypothetical protein